MMDPAIRKILTWAAGFDCQRAEHACASTRADVCAPEQRCVSCSAEHLLNEAGFIHAGELAIDVASCAVCGCTDDNACTPPCSWAEVQHHQPSLCSACVGAPAHDLPKVLG